MASVGRGSEPGLEPVAAPALDERIGLLAPTGLQSLLQFVPGLLVQVLRQLV